MAPARPPKVAGASAQSVPATWKLAGADAIATALWVLCSSLFAEVASYLAALSGQNESLIGLSVLVLALAAFAPVCNALGGSLFNPLNSIALIASSTSPIATNLGRMGGQLAGAFVGTVVAVRLIPEDLKGKFHTLSGGLRDGVAFELGFACEGALSFVLNYIFLLSIGSKSKLLTVWVPMTSAIVLTWVGFHFTGPSLNPFISFSWHLHYQRQSLTEHILVFWTAPILGALSAGALYSLLSTPSKKRRRSRPALQSKKQH